ncbi:uroporphyrinogen-III synthase [Clostridium sp. K25]|uniref:uroporphyrinogen-III C-methyltransferase n=1 Tax=Clostridium botulinum D str. 1873 TaxID=592027 RepID=A0A9P2LMB0_CLOBO|nr:MULTISPECIES: uroporphyrinogen-III C-methyltransferase [Clostridium]EES92365.1 uroporphyrinogen III synthase/methyltransferase [Clostridium botulinum D str. 1873]KEI09524.1 uroporphyrinogen-III synthase [Clostridium sp. K25]MBO3442503.1 uroporphyrinogen-III C-methyltransferase [Clostridium haemolyticum]MCD3246651.1 uroporphyrinogen-III C-methyltransferase [Clostridium botulinum C]MCD3262960.1 uroporphyrinogen-III C-methyltransferase [Clostridium botulinum C]
MNGKVFLVGAGPGDYKLITLKGMECIKKADVIVYDRLASTRLLKEAKENCEFIYVGKKSSNHTKTQDEINDIIVHKAKMGKIVTRLKGGDPYVFGRGGEEGEYLRKKGVRFEVVPGITSAIGGLCYAGIPITHRDYASSFHVITGHLKEDGTELNWKSIASLEGTLVFLMGVSNLKNICNSLIKEGKNKSTKAAIINWASTTKQKVVVGNLQNIYEKAMAEKINSPSLIVIGEVVSLRDKLNFFEDKPLFGKNIVVTRSRVQSSNLVEKIIDLGGNPIEIPTIKIEEIVNNVELDNGIKNINEFNYLIFTSRNAVKIFFKRLFGLNFDSRNLRNLKIVCIGTGTADELKKYGIIPDILPKKFIAESIIESLKEVVKKDDRVFIPRSSEARTYLVEELNKLCHVTEVKIYNTIKDSGKKDEIVNLLNNRNIDYITFTSSSTVKNFIEVIGKENVEKLKNEKLVSIGPITSKTIEDFGLKVYNEAKEYTIEGIIKTLIRG